MGPLNWLFGARRDTLGLACRVATASQWLVWQHIAPRAGTVASFPEAQGYIQARAKSFLRRTFARVVSASERQSAAHEHQILALALTMVTAQLTSPMLHVQPAAVAARRVA